MFVKRMKFLEYYKKLSKVIFKVRLAMVRSGLVRLD